MSLFSDMLKEPLPSRTYDEFDESSDEFDMSSEIDDALSDFGESDDELDLDAIDDLTGEGDSDYGDDEEDDDEDDDDEEDDDEDEEDDEEEIDDDLFELEKELGVNGNLPDMEEPDLSEVPTSVDDPTPAKPLEGDDDQEADNMMAICATPVVLDETLTTEAAEEFIESGEYQMAIAEGLILESDLDQMIAELSDAQEFTEGAFAAPGKKYKMTKKARFNQLYELSLQIEARAHRDPFYPKLQKAYKIERTIKAGWRKRYGALAKRRAMKYLKRLAASKSSTLRSAAKKIVPNLGKK